MLHAAPMYRYGAEIKLKIMLMRYFKLIFISCSTAQRSRKCGVGGFWTVNTELGSNATVECFRNMGSDEMLALTIYSV